MVKVCGRSLMVELVLAKDWVRVRFPAPAQKKKLTNHLVSFFFCAGEQANNFACIRESEPD